MIEAINTFLQAVFIMIQMNICQQALIQRSPDAAPELAIVCFASDIQARMRADPAKD